MSALVGSNRNVNSPKRLFTSQAGTVRHLTSVPLHLNPTSLWGMVDWDEGRKKINKFISQKLYFVAPSAMVG